MDNLGNVIGRILKVAIRSEIWIDGSFLTEKLNPDDVDMVLTIAAQDFLALDAAQRRFFEWFKSTNLYKPYRIDNYVYVRDDAVVESEYMYAYWLRQFGFSRGSEMKGLAVVKTPFLVTP